MRFGRRVALLTLSVALIVFVPPAKGLGRKEKGEALNIDALLQQRDPATLLADLDEEMREKVQTQWDEMVMADSQTALTRNQGGLYPNPILQAYVNHLGQSLIPKEASDKVFVSFKIVEDPLPYADTLATGTVYLSTGMISLLDNESQLAFLLMHEAGHIMLSHSLHQLVEIQRAEKRAGKIKMVSSIIGAVAGGLMGGKKDFVGGALVGGVVGATGADIASGFAMSLRNHRYLREIQVESDEFATQVLLQHGFDAREAPALMAKIGDIVRRSGAAAKLAFGSADDLPERAEKVTALLAGSYQPEVSRILSGQGFRMSSPRYSQLLAELRRDNGLLALERDLYLLARTNLEEAAAVRTDDPLTMFGLGMLYRTVGRSQEDVARAAGYLKSAMEFDEIRHRFPEVYMQYSVELLSRENPVFYPEIQKALKTYVILAQRNSGGHLPREMRFVYDYLDLTGDRGWIAYSVNNVSSDAPYQLVGDPKVDGTPHAATLAEAAAAKPAPTPAKKLPVKN